MLTRTSAFPERQAACPYCGHQIGHWPKASSIEPCRMCRRPMVLIRWPLDWNGPKRLRGLLDVGYTVYGLATLALVGAFAFVPMSVRTFVHLFSVLLFVAGTLLGVDGILGLRTGLDRTDKRVLTGKAAYIMASLKIAAGTLAMILLAMGLAV